MKFWFFVSSLCICKKLEKIILQGDLCIWSTTLTSCHQTHKQDLATIFFVSREQVNYIYIYNFSHFPVLCKFIDRMPLNRPSRIKPYASIKSIIIKPMKQIRGGYPYSGYPNIMPRHTSNIKLIVQHKCWRLTPHTTHHVNKMSYTPARNQAFKKTSHYTPPKHLTTLHQNISPYSTKTSHHTPPKRLTTLHQNISLYFTKMTHQTSLKRLITLNVVNNVINNVVNNYYPMSSTIIIPYRQQLLIYVVNNYQFMLSTITNPMSSTMN